LIVIFKEMKDLVNALPALANALQGVADAMRDVAGGQALVPADGGG